MEAMIQKKPTHWLVHADTGTHEFATEKEAKEFASQKPTKDETAAPEEKDSLSAES